MEWNGKSRLPLEEALKHVEPQQCYVYRLSVPADGTNIYIGFTTQNPSARLEQHLNSAKEGSNQEIHKELRKYGMLHEFEVISSTLTKSLALWLK